MNDHNLDDLIIGEPAPVGKKSKSLLVMIALTVIILLLGILLSKMILGGSDEEITLAEENQTEFVSPDLIPEESANQKKESDLQPIANEKLPTPQKQPVKKPVKKPVVVKADTEKSVVQKSKPKKPTPKKVIPKKPVSKPVKKKPSKPSTLFAEGKPVYYIQIGAFNRDPNPKFLKKIEAAGLVYKINKNEKTRRVRVGPYGSYGEAKAALVEVNSSIGIMGFVVKQK